MRNTGFVGVVCQRRAKWVGSTSPTFLQANKRGDMGTKLDRMIVAGTWLFVVFICYNYWATLGLVRGVFLVVCTAVIISISEAIHE